MSSKNIDLGLLILRLSVAGLMLFHGLAKLGGLEGLSGMLSSKGIPGVFAYLVYFGEIIAPLFIIVGFRTRIAAAILAINCIVAMFLAHSEDLFTLSDHGGWSLELLGLYLFGSVALFFTGAGKYAASSSHTWD